MGLCHDLTTATIPGLPSADMVAWGSEVGLYEEGKGQGMESGASDDWSEHGLLASGVVELAVIVSPARAVSATFHATATEVP